MTTKKGHQKFWWIKTEKFCWEKVKNCNKKLWSLKHFWN